MNADKTVFILCLSAFICVHLRLYFYLRYCHFYREVSNPAADWATIVKIGMKFSVDAHAIGRHLTGNEVYVRNLLNAFAGLDSTSEFVTYLSTDSPSPWVPSRFAVRRVSANPFVRLG